MGETGLREASSFGPEWMVSVQGGRRKEAE